LIKGKTMNTQDAILGAYGTSEMISSSYLEDLTDAEIFVRPVEGANHIAWQLGHLISSEHQMISAVCPDSMPGLPEGFSEKHVKDTAGSDNPSDFLTKSEYVSLAAEQRAATRKALATLSDSDLDKPGMEGMEHLCPTVGATFNMQATHWDMHAGQWAIVRRKLGRQPLF